MKCKTKSTLCEIASDVLILLFAGLCIFAVSYLCGCSQLRPTSKSQQMTTFSLGLPAVVVVSTTSFDAENSGDDEHSGMTATNDVSPKADIDLKKDKEDETL